MVSLFRQDLKEIVKEQVEYRGLLYEITKRDLLVRYKQTVMGFGWAVCMPLLNTAVFTVVFTRVVLLDVGVPYPLFAYCGLWAWNFTASALRSSATSLTSNTTLVTKVWFPREIFPLSTVIVSLVDFAVASAILAAFMVYYKTPVGFSLICLPIIVGVQIMLTTAIAMLLAMGTLFYRDVKYLFEVVLVVWMFATSVVYPIERVDGRLGALVRANPMTVIVDSYRAVLLHAAWPPALPMLVVGTLSAAVMVGAWVVFHRSEFEFAECV